MWRRSIYLLRQQIPIKAWVNAVVYFDQNEPESISSKTENIWFNDIQELVNHILTEGKESFGNNAEMFFEQCTAADCLYTSNGGGLDCIIQRDSLSFWPHIPMESIYIEHHWSFDKLYINTSDGSTTCIKSENAKLHVNCNGRIYTYALCKIDFIEFGRTL